MLEKLPENAKEGFNLEKEFSGWESKVLNLYDILINDNNFNDTNLVNAIHKIYLLQSKINEIPQEIKDKILENTDKRIEMIRYTNTILYNLSDIRKKPIFHADDDEAQELKHSLSVYLLSNMHTLKQDFYKNPGNYDIDKIELPKNLPYSKNMVACDFFNLFMHIQRNTVGMSNYLPYAEKAFMSCDEAQKNSIIREYDNGGESAYLLSKLYRDGSQEFKEYFDKYLEGVVSGMSESKNADLIPCIFQRGSLTEIEKKLFFEINKYFKDQYNIDDKDFAESLNYTDGSIHQMIAMMNLIDDDYPDGCSLLNKKYNICEFSRYPPDILLNQLRNENMQEPYGLMVFPRSDHNGAFNRMWGPISNIYEETEGKHLLRIFEASNKRDIARILIECDQKYGAKNKISFIVLGGHGSIETLDLGSHISLASMLKLNFESHVIKSDFEGKGVQKINKFFVEKPAITLISCETGGEDGLIDSISKIYNAEVVAPKVSTGVDDIHVNYDENGTPHFDVSWSEEKANSVYISGNKVE
ncbi:hypothetical protein IT400_04030 [Candidatus Nomurabacteria bacterium]|nr:hypothetical protein [Candidatus Nomurabacteria bacterium]